MRCTNMHTHTPSLKCAGDAMHRMYVCPRQTSVRYYCRRVKGPHSRWGDLFFGFSLILWCQVCPKKLHPHHNWQCDLLSLQKFQTHTALFLHLTLTLCLATVTCLLIIPSKNLYFFSARLKACGCNIGNYMISFYNGVMWYKKKRKEIMLHTVGSKRLRLH